MPTENEKPNIETFEDFMVNLVISQSAVILADMVIEGIRESSKDNDFLRMHRVDVYDQVIKRLQSERDSISSENGVIAVE